MRSRLPLLLPLIALLTPAFARADAKADAILKQSEEHTLLGYDGSEAELELVLTNKRGTQRTRKLQTISEKRDGQRRVLVRFLEPPDVSGTGFLVLERRDAEDEQFLYMPALRKVRQISASQKGGSFMGTDLSYDDLQSHDVSETENTVLREETLKDSPCWVLESLPKPGQQSQYSRALRWVRKKDHVPIRMELFQQGDPARLHKVMEVLAVGKKQGKVIIREAQMQDVQKSHTTLLKLTRIELDRKFSDTDFTTQALEKGR